MGIEMARWQQNSVRKSMLAKWKVSSSYGYPLLFTEILALLK